MMKKTRFWSLLALCFCLAGAMTFTACGDDDEDNTLSPMDNPAASASDLIGTWSFDGVTYVFTNDQLTISYQEQVNFKGTYTYANGVLKYQTEQGLSSASVALLYGKTVLVLKTVPDNADDFSLAEVAEVLYKDGKAPQTPATDIQGTWHWYMRGDSSYIRAGVMISGNKIEIIITPWSERHVGTFTYEGGILHLNMTEFYSGRGEHGYGTGEGRINPATLECDNWIPCTKEDIGDHISSEMQFIANGSEAYGGIAGLPAIFVKK